MKTNLFFIMNIHNVHFLLHHYISYSFPTTVSLENHHLDPLCSPLQWFSFPSFSSLAVCFSPINKLLVLILSCPFAWLFYVLLKTETTWCLSFPCWLISAVMIPSGSIHGDINELSFFDCQIVFHCVNILQLLKGNLWKLTTDLLC